MNEIAFETGLSHEFPDCESIRQQETPGRRHLPQNISRSERLISCVGGSVLFLGGLARGKLSGLLMCGLGGAMLYRGITGHCHAYDALGVDTHDHNDATAVPAQQGVKIEKAIAINRKPEDLFAFWSDLEQLPVCMRHLEQVQQQQGNRSHWIARGPLGIHLEWDAEIIEQRDNEMISWRSLPGSEVETAGSVHFKPIDADRGTAVTLSLKYNPPGGNVSDAAASLLGSNLEQEIAEDLRRFKSLMEAGEIPTHG